jgi:hypothetical protein
MVLMTMAAATLAQMPFWSEFEPEAEYLTKSIQVTTGWDNAPSPSLKWTDSIWVWKA